MRRLSPPSQPPSKATAEPAVISCCGNEIEARRKCYANSGERLGGEQCLQEELLEKRCLSAALCPADAARFYGSDPHRKAQCALWAEAFAFGAESARVGWLEQEQHRDAHAEVSADARKAKRCRAAARELTQCMHSQRHRIPP